jgi:hypothetical protein
MTYGENSQDDLLSVPEVAEMLTDKLQKLVMIRCSASLLFLS